MCNWWSVSMHHIVDLSAIWSQESVKQKRQQPTTFRSVTSLWCFNASFNCAFLFVPSSQCLLQCVAKNAYRPVAPHFCSLTSWEKVESSILEWDFKESLRAVCICFPHVSTVLGNSQQDFLFYASRCAICKERREADVGDLIWAYSLFVSYDSVISSYTRWKADNSRKFMSMHDFSSCF